MSKWDAILVGDLHLRADTPICRTDDFMLTQINKLEWLWALQDEHECGVIQAGDVFHHWKRGFDCLYTAIKNLPQPMWLIPGNHDLPNHDISQIAKTPLMILQELGINIIKEPTLVDRLQFLPFGTKPVNKYPVDLLVVHEFNYPKASGLPYVGCVEQTSEGLLKKYPFAHTILSGDNHTPFVIEGRGGRTVINPGSFTRQTAKETHEPCVFLWRRNGEYEKVMVPHDKDAVTRDHIVVKEKSDEQIRKFVEALKQNQLATCRTELNFERALRGIMKENEIHPKTEEQVWSAFNDNEK